MNAVNNISEPNSPRQINPLLLRSLSLKLENNLVDFLIVVIDALIETSNEWQLLISDLRNIANNPVHEFNNLDASLTFIQNNEATKICLIISGSFGETHNLHLFELTKIECIYVFCHDRAKHQIWAQSFTKIQGVFNNKTELLKTVSRDVKNYMCRWSFLDESSFQKASTNDGRWYQLFIRVLVHQPKTEDTWNEMLNECRSFYRQDAGMLEKIKNFKKDYTADKAIDYYCQSSFVFQIVNCALRTHNIDIIIKFQPYISDLYNELSKRYKRYIINLHQRKIRSPIRVAYRGQYMLETELERLKDYCQSRNSHVVLSTFGSATRDPEVAWIFCLDDRPGYVRCLYQIIIPDDYHTTYNMSLKFCQQFADIAETVDPLDEKEVLFGVGSLFRIKYIGKCTPERSWVPIVLELYADTGFDSCWSSLSRRLQDESNEMKKESLEFIKKYTAMGNKLNWGKWWQRFNKECGIRKRLDESLAIFMYEGFDSPESITKAIELYKQYFIFQSEEKNFHSFLTTMTSGTSTRTIALYEHFIQYFNQNNELFQYDLDNLTNIFQYAGDAYAHFYFFTEKALNCYRKALELAQFITNNQMIDNLERKIIALSSKTSIKEIDNYPKMAKKERTVSACISPEYRMELMNKADYEIENDQWSVLLNFRKATREYCLRDRMWHRLRLLDGYLNEREKWINNNYLKIFLKMPLEKQHGTVSLTDIYPFLFLSVLSCLHDGKVKEGTYNINLWQYEKFMLEWLSLNDVKRILMFYRLERLNLVIPILSALDRLIETLRLIIIWYTLTISMSPKKETDYVVVDANRIKFVKVGRVNVPKLVFFDERDEITHDTVRAELESINC